jgi:protein TonB
MNLKESAAIVFIIALLSAPDLRGQDTTGTVDRPPRFVVSVMPVYPEAALKDGLEGKVFVEVDIDTNGVVTQAVVKQSSNKVFDQPSIDAAMKYRFTPAVKDGKRVAVWVTIPFQYKPNEKGK